ncbi:cytochrome P450, partial [Lojkania enalia]
RTTGKPFSIDYWRKRYLVLHPKYLADVRRASREHLSFIDTISDMFFMYNWVGDLFKSSRMVFAVIKGVNPQLSILSKSMLDESSFAFEKEIGALEEQGAKKIATLDVMTKICLRIMTRVVAGKELSRNEEFHQDALAYFQWNFLCGFIMLKLPLPAKIRDLVTWPMWKYHQCFRQEKLIKTIKPIVSIRLKELNASDEQEFDVIRCTLNLLDDYPLDSQSKYSPAHTMAHEALQLIWASGQFPAMTTTTMIFRLLEDKEYMEPLYQEAHAAIRKHGWSDGIFNELPKMDSFIRECLRFDSAFPLSPTRMVKGKPFTFFDGFTLPVGTRIAFPTDICQRDPNAISKPDVFDGFRFVDLAANTAKEQGGNCWAANHCSSNNLAFGYGNHACPGRFIAVRLLKIMMCRLIIDYEISWDREGDGPPRYVLEGASVPNWTQKIALRKRSSAQVEQERRSTSRVFM